MSRYRFTRAWARFAVFAGFSFITLGVAAGLAMMRLVPLEAFERSIPTLDIFAVRLTVAIAAVLVGLAIGGPLVVCGQLVLVTLAQRDLLARQNRILRSVRNRLDIGERVRDGGREGTAVDRLLPRR